MHITPDIVQTMLARLVLEIKLTYSAEATLKSIRNAYIEYEGEEPHHSVNLAEWFIEKFEFDGVEAWEPKLRALN